MSRNIGIITFHFASNYGSSLQVYALYKTLAINGYNPIVIDYRPSYHTIRYNTYNSFKDYYEISGNRSVFYVLVKTVFKNFKGLFKFEKRIKNRRFNKFLNEYLRMTKRYHHVREITDEFDVYISGSDQIWNYLCVKDNEFGGLYDKAYFLSFVHNKKKIAYAVSAQHGDIRVDLDVAVLDLIKDYDYIYTREDSLRDSLTSLINKNVTTVLDPTLILDSKYYEEIEAKISIKGDYLLVYNLDGKYSDLVEKSMLKLANELKLKIIDISPSPFNLKNSIKVKSCGPKEFLSYIHNAKYIITNSFHAVVFSIIYNKNFNCVLRDDNDYRIMNILKIIGLNTKLVNKNMEIDVSNIDYKNVECILKKYKDDSINCLLNAVKE